MSSVPSAAILSPDAITHILLLCLQLYTFPVLDMIEIGLVKRGIPNGWITRLIYRCGPTTTQLTPCVSDASHSSLVAWPIFRGAPAACPPPTLWPVASVTCHPSAFVLGSPAAFQACGLPLGAGPLPTLALALTVWGAKVTKAHRLTAPVQPGHCWLQGSCMQDVSQFEPVYLLNAGVRTSSLLHSLPAPFPSLGEYMLRLWWHMTFTLNVVVLCMSVPLACGSSRCCCLTHLPVCSDLMGFIG